MADVKVYCENCIFLSVSESPSPFDFGPPIHQIQKCLAPQNFHDTHISPKVLPISQPQVINKFNKCLWYVQKESPVSSSSGNFSSSSSSTP